MRRKALLLCIIFCLPLIATSLFAETDILGWGKAKWGMTQSQLKKLYEIEKCTEFEGTLMCALIEKLNIQGHNFKLVFTFDENSPSGKLIKISMSSTATTLDENAFGSVLGLLVRKYGQPDSKKSYSIAKTSLWLKTSGQLEFQTMFDRASPNSAFVLCIIDYIAVVSDANRL